MVVSCNNEVLAFPFVQLVEQDTQQVVGLLGLLFSLVRGCPAIDVEGQHLAQKQFKSSGIRLTAGDRVTISAEGTITMTPWGSNARSTPDGAPNYGWYMGNQIAAGALVGRIGDSGTVFKVGRQSSFTAKKSGVLQLAIGMHPSYINNAFPGKYTTKIRVRPK